VTGQMIIEGVENRTISVTEAEYLRLGHSRVFRSIVSAGIASLVITRRASWGIKTAGYVGQVLLEGDVRLRLREKIPGALAALLAWSSPEDFREELAKSPLGKDGADAILDAYARRLLSHIAEYVRHGRQKEYQRQQLVTSSPRGKIAVRGTMRLISRGIAGRVVVANSRLSANLMANRLLSLGLRAVDDYYRTANPDSPHLSKARYLAPLFEDVDGFSVERMHWLARARAFDEALADRRTSGDLRDALTYCRAFVLHLGQWPEDMVDGYLPRAFFLNLSTLFEEAVRLALATVVADNCSVKHGRSQGVHIFKDNGRHFEAEPDIVVRRSEQAVLVADVKYKTLDDSDGLPGHDDVYQLLAHAAAFKSQTALLIYPGELAWLGRLGLSHGGIEVFFCTVRPAHLFADLSSAATRLHLRTPKAEMVAPSAGPPLAGESLEQGTVVLAGRAEMQS